MPEKTRILIIDDEADIIRGISLRLRAAGYETLTASDGLSGLATATEQTPDLILMDICMPGMNGLDVLSTLKKLPATNSIPVLIMSANVAEGSKTRALSLGAESFIQKPFEAESVLDEIKKHTANVS